MTSPVAQMVKRPPTVWDTRVQSLGREDLLEKGRATHSSILAPHPKKGAQRNISFPGGSDGKASAYNAGDLGLIPRSGRSPGEGKGNPLQYSCLENLMDGGAWWATVHRVAKSRTGLSDFTFTFPGGSEVKASAWNAGDPGSIPESGRSPGEGNGNPLQYSCLENPMEGGAW